MTIEVTIQPTSSFSIDDLFGSIEFIAFESDISRFTTNFFGLTGTYAGQTASVSVNGSGFATSSLGGETFVTSGIITLIDFRAGGESIRFEDVNIDLSTFSQAVIAVETGSDPQAVERDLLGRAWDLSLGDSDDLADKNTVLPRGTILNLTEDDIFRGGGGNDNLFTGDGDDMLYGDEGNDRLDAGKGNDMIFGGDGNDTIFGRNGKDVIDVGRGNDKVFGGNGNDVFVFGDNYGRTKLNDFDENRRKEDIDLSSVTEITGFKDLKNNHMEQVRKKVIIDDGAGTVIVLNATEIDDMNKGDFLF